MGKAMTQNLPAFPHDNLPGMAEALAARQRIDAGLTWLRHHAAEPLRAEKGQARLIHIATREWLPALHLIATSPDLEARLADTEERLERGKDVAGDRADARWTQLLAEYECLCDARNTQYQADPRNPLVALFDRMAAIERVMLRTEPSDSPARVEAVA